eukprot:m.80052 g.80052  ORF g.80052 m.80052 type:complete len:873 (-) comp8617_c0_seq1:305-2923(-)
MNLFSTNTTNEDDDVSDMNCDRVGQSLLEQEEEQEHPHQESPSSSSPSLSSSQRNLPRRSQALTRSTPSSIPKANCQESFTSFLPSISSRKSSAVSFKKSLSPRMKRPGLSSQSVHGRESNSASPSLKLPSISPPHPGRKLNSTKGKDRGNNRGSNNVHNNYDPPDDVQNHVEIVEASFPRSRSGFLSICGSWGGGRSFKKMSKLEKTTMRNKLTKSCDDLSFMSAHNASSISPSSTNGFMSSAMDKAHNSERFSPLQPRKSSSPLFSMGSPSHHSSSSPEIVKKILGRNSNKLRLNSNVSGSTSKTLDAPLVHNVMPSIPLCNRRRESFFTPSLEIETDELHRFKCHCATKIQAVWRGYRARCKVEKEKGKLFSHPQNPGYAMKTKEMRKYDSLPDAWFVPGKVVEEENVLGKYEILEKVGSGNFADVVKCRDKNTLAILALKIVPKYKVYANLQRRLMKAEIDVLGSISHPNIISLQQTMETHTHVYLIMDYIKNGDLFDMISSAEGVSENNAQHAMRDICEALKYLHSRHIVHRDIKPENIMCQKILGFNDSLSAPNGGTSSNFIMKLVDFGLAQRVTNNLNEVCGSPTYMAPEITLQDRDGYNVLCDMWSLGVVMFIMVTGFPPFSVPLNSSDIRESHYEVDLFADDSWEKVSIHGKRLLTALLQRDPNKRSSAEHALRSAWFKENREMLGPAAILNSTLRLKKNATISTRRKFDTTQIMRRKDSVRYVANFIMNDEGEVVAPSPSLLNMDGVNAAQSLMSMSCTSQIAHVLGKLRQLEMEEEGDYFESDDSDSENSEEFNLPSPPQSSNITSGFPFSQLQFHANQFDGRVKVDMDKNDKLDEDVMNFHHDVNIESHDEVDVLHEYFK